MPDVIGPHFISPTTPNGSTYMEITGYSLTPRTDTPGTHVVLNMHIKMGANSGLYTSSTDLALGRKVVGTINGNSIGEHLIKRHAYDRWELGANYYYTITCDIPYSPGAVYINIQVVPEGSGSSKYMTTSTFTTGTNQYTVNSGYGAAPSFGSGLTLNGQPSVIVGFLDGTLNLAWPAATPGTGAIQAYSVYWSTDAVNWNFRGQTGGLSYTIYPGHYGIARGAYVWFLVQAVGLYGWANGANYPTMQLALTPSAVSALTVTPSPAQYKAQLTLGWALPSAGSGTIDQIELSVRHKPRGGAWSEWVTFKYLTTETSTTTTPYDYVAPWKAGPGSTYQYQIRVRNSYGVWSATTLSSEILLKGGIMRLRNATWKEGNGYVKVAGVWKEASSVYVKAGGTWKESA